MAKTFDLECPCCGATLRIDPEVKAVLSHKEKPVQKSLADIQSGLAALKKKESERDSVFAKRVEEEKSSKDVLARKFDELLKQAKEDPHKGPPKKPIGLE
jgi:hypothetical protein